MLRFHAPRPTPRQPSPSPTDPTGTPAAVVVGLRLFASTDLLSSTTPKGIAS